MSDAIRTPLAQRMADLRRGPLTVAVWIAAAGAATVMLAYRGRSLQHVGLARAIEYEVSSTVTGSVESLAVDVFEEVEAGQILAVLDGKPVSARLATASAELARLRSMLDAEASRASADGASVSGELRSFQMDEERLRLQALALRVELESDRIEKARLDLKAAREGELAKDGLVSQSQVDDARLSRDALARRIEENGALLAKTEADHDKARGRREEFAKRYTELDPEDPVLTPLREAVRVQERRIEEIEVERRALVLYAPVEGRVSEVRTRRGQTVLPGEPCLLVAQKVATEVLVYVPEAVARSAKAGAAVQVASDSAKADSVVDRVGPSVKELPRELWRNPALPEYGVPLLVRGIAGLSLLPGERVTVRLASART